MVAVVVVFRAFAFAGEEGGGDGGLLGEEKVVDERESGGIGIRIGIGMGSGIEVEGIGRENEENDEEELRN